MQTLTSNSQQKRSKTQTMHPHQNLGLNNANHNTNSNTRSSATACRCPVSSSRQMANGWLVAVSSLDTIVNFPMPNIHSDPHFKLPTKPSRFGMHWTANTKLHWRVTHRASRIAHGPQTHKTYARLLMTAPSVSGALPQ